MRRTISRRYGALLAAGRDREATRIAEALLSHLDDDLSRIALVKGALTAGQGQEHAERHKAWLEDSLR